MSGPPFNYNDFQQIYCLNAVANAVGRITKSKEDLESILRDKLKKFVPDAGNWTVTWGPAVFKTEPDDASQAPDNAWFIAQNGSKHVVAVAGTAYPSKAGAQIDIKVATTVNFNDWVSKWTDTNVPYVSGGKTPSESIPYISEGTSIGVANILNTTSIFASKGQTITQYLQALPQEATIVFTGHSMGGALTPTIALGLKQAKLVGPAKNVYVVPSAGACPGNNAFVQAYKTLFPPGGGSGYARYNIDFYNVNDIVPQAWSLQSTDDRNFHNIKSIYGKASNWPLSKYSLAYVTCYGLSQQSRMSYRPIPGGSFSTKLPSPLTISDDLLLEQHIDEYWNIIGIKPYVDRFTKALEEDGIHLISTEDFEWPEGEGLPEGDDPVVEEN